MRWIGCARIGFPILREPPMPQDAGRLIWIDLEMTGLKPETSKKIVEVMKKTFGG